MQIEQQIEEIKRGLSFIKYNDAEVYFIDEEVLKNLLLLENKIRAEYKGRTKNPFGRYAKLLNPGKIAIKYNFYMRKTPRIIKDAQKVFEALDKEFLLFKNVLLKEFEEGIESNKELEESEVIKLREEVNNRIDTEYKQLEDIKRNFNSYEVVITNYNQAREYPTIHYTSEDKKHYTEHLSIKVPNFLFYREEASDSKSTASIKKFINTANLIGNTIYYKRKGWNVSRIYTKQ